MIIKKLLKNKVFKNFSYLTFGSIISQLLMLFTIIKITNTISPEDYGIYSFIIAQGLLLITISELGSKAIIIRRIARQPNQSKDIIINGVKLRIISMFLIVGIYIIYNHYLGSLTYLQILLLIIYSLVNTIFHLFEHIFIGNQKMYFPSIIKSGTNLLYFLIVLILPKSLYSINLLVGSYALVCFIQTISYLVLLNKNNLILGEKNKFLESSKNLLTESWPYMALMFLSLPMLHLSNNFLDINSTKDEVGYFNLAKKLMGPVQLVITFSLTAIFPNISALYLKDEIKFKSLITKGMPIFIGLTSIFCFTFTLFSNDIILLIFSTKYLPAIKVIQLQVWFLFLNGINHFIAVIYGAANLEKEIYKFALVNLIISAPFLYFGSLYGALGISYGFVISYAIFELYIWMKFRNNLNVKISHEKSVWIISIIMFITSYLMSNTQIHYKILTMIGIGGIYGYYIYKNFNYFKITTIEK